jgi:hypothetical protein
MRIADPVQRPWRALPRLVLSPEGVPARLGRTAGGDLKSDPAWPGVNAIRSGSAGAKTKAPERPPEPRAGRRERRASSFVRGRNPRKSFARPDAV